MRTALAKQQGVDESLIADLNDYQNGPFTRAEKLALQLAETIAYDPNGLDDAFAAELRDEFSEAQIVELAFAAAIFFGTGRMVAAFGLPLEPERLAHRH